MNGQYTLGITYYFLICTQFFVFYVRYRCEPLDNAQLTYYLNFGHGRNTKYTYVVSALLAHFISTHRDLAHVHNDQPNSQVPPHTTSD